MEEDSLDVALIAIIAWDGAGVRRINTDPSTRYLMGLVYEDIKKEYKIGVPWKGIEAACYAACERGWGVHDKSVWEWRIDLSRVKRCYEDEWLKDRFGQRFDEISKAALDFLVRYELLLARKNQSLMCVHFSDDELSSMFPSPVTRPARPIQSYSADKR